MIYEQQQAAPRCAYYFFYILTSILSYVYIYCTFKNYIIFSKTNKK